MNIHQKNFFFFNRAITILPLFTYSVCDEKVKRKARVAKLIRLRGHYVFLFRQVFLQKNWRKVLSWSGGIEPPLKVMELQGEREGGGGVKGRDVEGMSRATSSWSRTRFIAQRDEYSASSLSSVKLLLVPDCILMKLAGSVISCLIASRELPSF